MIHRRLEPGFSRLASWVSETHISLWALHVVDLMNHVRNHSKPCIFWAKEQATSKDLLAWGKGTSFSFLFFTMLPLLRLPPTLFHLAMCPMIDSRIHLSGPKEEARFSRLHREVGEGLREQVRDVEGPGKENSRKPCQLYEGRIKKKKYRPWTSLGAEGGKRWVARESGREVCGGRREHERNQRTPSTYLPSFIWISVLGSLEDVDTEQR